MPQNPWSAPTGVSYKHMSNSQTLLIKASPGVLFSVIFNGGSTSATLTLYDSSATGTLTPTILVWSVAGTSGAQPPQKIDYGSSGTALTTATGLVGVSTGTGDWTILFH